MNNKFFPWEGGVYLLVYSTHRPCGWYAETRFGRQSFGPYKTKAQAMRHIKPSPQPEKMSKQQEKYWAQIERNVKLQRKISSDNWRRRNSGVFFDQENFTFIPKPQCPSEFKKICIDLDKYWELQQKTPGLLSIERFIAMCPEGVIAKNPHKKRI